MIGIVPARGGSVGLRHKNLLTIEGVPLVINAAREVAMIVRGVQRHKRTKVTTKLAGHWAGRILGYALDLKRVNP